MTEKLKKFIEENFSQAEKYAITATDVNTYRSICFGAMLYAFKENPNEDEINQFRYYWNSEIRPRFQEMANKKPLTNF